MPHSTTPWTSDVVIVAPIMGDIGKVLARERALVEGRYGSS
jgi:hypothetical protein